METGDTIGDRLRRLIEDGQVPDPRFQDPARFPCGVVGCEERAHGWVLLEAMDLHGMGSYEVRSESEHAYLCREHLRPLVAE